MIGQITSRILKQTTNKIRYNFSKVSVQLPDFETHRLDSYELPQVCQIEKEQLLKVYEEMTLMRRMEVASDQLYKERLIRGFCHLYDGQEGVIQGIEDAITLDDLMITAYRCHCHALKRGESVHSIIAEMLGKKTGGSKGKGGSMHFYSEKENFYGGNGIVGAQVPVGAGLGFALKYQGKKNIAITMYGDGAANQGQLFEAANMAFLWKIPVLFICENNKYAMGTSVERHAMNPNFFQRGDSIPGLKMDGNNYFQVYEGMKWAKQYAIEQGPLFIEIESYRYHGHSMSDPGVSYRSREEVQEHRKTKDCINLVKNTILENQLYEAAELKKIDKKCKKIVDEAIVKAKADPFPEVENDLYADVYAENDRHFMRGVEYQTSHALKPL